MNQKKMIFDYLKKYGSITPAEALDMFGCMRLSARIYELRADGCDIVAEVVGGVNRYGKRVYFTRYKLRT